MDLKKLHRTGASGQRGEGMTEYVVLLILVLLAGAVGYTIFRSQMASRVRTTADLIDDRGRSARTARSEAPQPDVAFTSRPDRTVPLPEPSIVERFLSNPETILAWLFILFMICMALFRSIRKGSEEQQAEEARRLEEARAQQRRDYHRFEAGTVGSEGEAAPPADVPSAGEQP